MRKTTIPEHLKAEILRRVSAGESVRGIGAALGIGYGSVHRYVTATRAQQGVVSAVARGRMGGRPRSDGTPRPVIDRTTVTRPDSLDELDDYDRRRWLLVDRIDAALESGDVKPRDIADLSRAQASLLAQLQSSAQMKRATGDTNEGMADIAANVRARLQRLAAAQAAAVAVEAEEPIETKPEPATGTDGS